MPLIFYVVILPPLSNCKKDKRRTSLEFLRWSKSGEARITLGTTLWNLPFISLQFKMLKIKILGWVVTAEGSSLRVHPCMCVKGHNRL